MNTTAVPPHDQSAELVREAAKRAPGVTLDEERELARQIKAGSRTALDRMLRVQRALEQLPSREREIVEQRHLRDSPPSLAELGRNYGVSSERVRQIESKARDRMRELLADGARAASAP